MPIFFIQTEALICQAADAELLVYDPALAQAHCLSADAAKIFEACREPASMEGMADQTGLALGQVQATCAHLVSLNLLRPTEEVSDRRTVLRALGQLAAAAGVISLAVPTAAAAASCFSAINCQNANGVSVCDTCNPPSCTGTVVKQFSAFPNLADQVGGQFCAGTLGPSALSACDGAPHSARPNCNQAKREMEVLTGGGSGRYYCCSLTGATCATTGQCANANAIWLGSPCCISGTCRNTGACT